MYGQVLQLHKITREEFDKSYALLPVPSRIDESNSGFLSKKQVYHPVLR